MKHSGKIKDILFYSGLLKLASNFRNGKIVSILRYHSVVEPANNYYVSPNIAMHPEIFEKHVKYFSKNFNVISLDTVAGCIEERKPFPDRAVVFTFDDGYRDNFTAYKILKKYCVTGTFYLATSCIDNKTPLWMFKVIYLLKHTNKTQITLDGPDDTLNLKLKTKTDRLQAARQVIILVKSNDLKNRESILEQICEQIEDVADFQEKSKMTMLSWDQVKEMADNGMDIGGHTMTHLNLPNADPSDAYNEIKGCKEEIEANTGKVVNHFSYPNGGPYAYYTPAIIDMVKSMGFKTSTTSNNGTALLQSSPFELKRIRITDSISEILYQICAE